MNKHLLGLFNVDVEADQDLNGSQDNEIEPLDVAYYSQNNVPEAPAQPDPDFRSEPTASQEPDPLHAGPASQHPQTDQEVLDTLVKAIAARYVRREQRFYHIDRPIEGLSRRDLEQTFLHQASNIVPWEALSASIMKHAFDISIEQKHTDRTRSVQVWGGSMSCHPGDPRRIFPEPSGSVSLNTWSTPAYRTLGLTEATDEPFAKFFSTLFPRDAERHRVLDWVAWSLQNEKEKPSWALILYSKEKGTGKSTFCDLLRHLFGPKNTATQNNVDKLAARFNSVPLTNKLVISEEFSLRPDSNQSNAIKTYITDKTVLVERKGREAEECALVSCFVFTSNHLPTWLEEGERRYYIVDTGHDGHSSGQKASEFSELVQSVYSAMKNPEHIARLYNHLIQRQLGPDFNAGSLNTVKDGTEFMKRVQSAPRHAQVDQLDEFLKREGKKAVTQNVIKDYVIRELRISLNATRYLMIELGWTQCRLKWGGVDYARTLWVEKNYWVANGDLYGPDGFKVALCDHLWDEPK